MPVLLLGLGVVLGCGQGSDGQPPQSAGALDFTPSRSLRTEAEAREAFRLLLSTPGARGEERERYTLMVYNAGKDGAKVCSEALRSRDVRERRLAMGIVCAEITAQEGWHPYQDHLRWEGLQAFGDVAVQNVSCFIEGKEIEDPNSIIPGMLFQLLQHHVSTAAHEAEGATAVTGHPLYVWFKQNESKLGCEWDEPDDARRKELVRIWREWARDNAADFAATLKSYHKLIEQVKNSKKR